MGVWFETTCDNHLEMFFSEKMGGR